MENSILLSRVLVSWEMDSRLYEFYPLLVMHYFFLFAKQQNHSSSKNTFVDKHALDHIFTNLPIIRNIWSEIGSLFWSVLLTVSSGKGRVPNYSC